MGIMDKIKSLFKENEDQIISAGAGAYHSATGKTLDVDKFKMIVLDRNKDVMTKAISVCSKDVLNAESSVNANSLADMLFRGSGVMQDKAVRELITYGGLEDPQRLAKFLVELHLAQIDAFNDSFDLLGDMHLNDYAARIKDGKSYLKQYYRAQTEEEQQKKLEKAADQFMQARHRYEGAIQIYVQSVQKIVDKPKFLRGKRALETMDGYMQKLQGLIKAEQEAVQLECEVAQLLNDSVVDAVDEYHEFFEQMIQPNIALLQGCSKDEDEAFWKDVEENGNVILVMG
jgi:hypothetical protein